MSALNGRTEAFAAAKVNLCLHVTGRREDGYHLLDSLVVFAEVGDQLSFSRSDAYSLEIEGPFAAALEPDRDNLVFRAAAQWGDLAPGAKITLNKTLPVAAGIGGGSADAAATLLGVRALYDLPSPPAEELNAMALALGADVPACLHSKALRMAGIGEAITPLATFPKLPAVLINPGVAVSTGPIFKALNLGQPSTGGSTLEELPSEGFTSVEQVTHWLQRQRNDLQAPAIALAPEIGTVLDTLNAAETCRLARMSGSGATCFGLFETVRDAEAFAAHLAVQEPDWWVVPTLFH